MSDMLITIPDKQILRERLLGFYKVTHFERYLYPEIEKMADTTVSPGILILEINRAYDSYMDKLNLVNNTLPQILPDIISALVVDYYIDESFLRYCTLEYENLFN